MVLFKATEIGRWKLQKAEKYHTDLEFYCRALRKPVQ